MKSQIDLEKAGTAEAFGVLATRRRRSRRQTEGYAAPFTAPQMRALSEIANSFLEIARDAGAEKKRIKLGSVSVELRENGVEEVLSIRKTLAR